MQTDYNVSILIVTHNHGKYLEKLIKSLEQFNYKDVYFCDANSADETIDILKNSIFKKNILFKKTLEGFAKNNNDLIRHFNLSSDYYLLLNPDVFFTQDFLLELVKSIRKDKEAASAAHAEYYPDGRLQVTWKKFPGLCKVLKNLLGKMHAIDEKQPEPSQIDREFGSC